MNTLVVDIGGTNVKVWRTGKGDKVKFPSGKGLTPQLMVEGVCKAAEAWHFERVSIGYPGHVLNGRPSADPYNLGGGWVEFDFAAALGVPVRIMNDACMQALGGYEGGTMLYIGLGTSVGTALIVEGKIVPLALGHLKFLRGETFEQSLGRRGLELHGKKRWRRAVSEAAVMLKDAFLANYIVFGGGNAKKLGELPPGCRLGGNYNAYFGGLRMWDDTATQPTQEDTGTPATVSMFPQGA